MNTDATIANISLGVGIAALVGAVVYWVVGSKSGSSSALVHVPQVTPMIGHSTGGLSLGGSF